MQSHSAEQKPSVELISEVTKRLQKEVKRLRDDYKLADKLVGSSIIEGKKLNRTQEIARKRMEYIYNVILYLDPVKKNSLKDFKDTPEIFDGSFKALENCLFALKNKMVSTGRFFQFITRHTSFWVTGRGEIDKILTHVIKQKPTYEQNKKARAQSRTSDAS